MDSSREGTYTTRTFVVSGTAAAIQAAHIAPHRPNKEKPGSVLQKALLSHRRHEDTALRMTRPSAQRSQYD